MPRDYIFATMTQFPWYHYPSAAAEMTFAAIFADLRAQALAHGHHLSYRFLCGMLEPHTSDDIEVTWLPATDVPEPRALGDFLKLFRGEPSLGDGIGSFRPKQPSWRIKVRTLPEELLNNAARMLDLVEMSMKASRNVWAAAQRGELSQFGSWPEENPDDFPRQMIKAYREAIGPGEQSEYTSGVMSAYERKLSEAEAQTFGALWILSLQILR
jgi:hypothetical protein